VGVSAVRQDYCLYSFVMMQVSVPHDSTVAPECWMQLHNYKPADENTQQLSEVMQVTHE